MLSQGSFSEIFCLPFNKLALKNKAPYLLSMCKCISMSDTKNFRKKIAHVTFFPTFSEANEEMNGFFCFSIFRCGAHVYNHYLDCRDTNYFVCEDTISDVLALPGEKVKHLTPVLACQDRSLRVLRDSTLMYNVELPGMYVSKCTNVVMGRTPFYRTLNELEHNLSNIE